MARGSHIGIPKDQPFFTQEAEVKEKSFILHPISDVHVGAEAHHDKAFKAKLDYIKDHPRNHRILLLGDLMDMSIKESVGFRYGAVTPQQELERMVELLEPVKDRIDLIIPGNHERRTLDRTVGLDVSAQLAALLGRPGVYRPACTVIRYKFNQKKDKNYRCNLEILCHHGIGGGRQPGGKINRASSLAVLKPDVDICLMGHVHENAARVEKVWTGFPPKVKRRYVVITGCWLGSEQYSKDAAYPPSVEGAPVIKIDSVNDQVVITVEVR